jgi:hypothetical protein
LILFGFPSFFPLRPLRLVYFCQVFFRNILFIRSQ